MVADFSRSTHTQTHHKFRCLLIISNKYKSINHARALQELPTSGEQRPVESHRHNHTKTPRWTHFLLLRTLWWSSSSRRDQSQCWAISAWSSFGQILRAITHTHISAEHAHHQQNELKLITVSDIRCWRWCVVCKKLVKLYTATCAPSPTIYRERRCPGKIKNTICKSSWIRSDCGWNKFIHRLVLFRSY